MNFWDYSVLVFTVLYTLVVVTTVYTVLFERRDPLRAVTWIAVVVLFPVGGLILYAFFGQSYRKRKIFNLKELRDLRQIDILSTWQINHIDEMQSGEVREHIDIVKLLLSNSRTPLTNRNEVDILNNGEATFAAMFADLRAAKSSIHMEYYIVDNDALGNELAEILCQKAREGVEVRFLYDDVGSWSLSHSYRRGLREAGVEIKSFMKVVFPWFTSKVNYRNHRKITVIDGRIGYTGGLNIADRYVHGVKWGIWRDTHLRMRGEVVRMLQATFATDWYFSTKVSLLPDSAYFPAVEDDIKDDVAVQLALSGPDSDYASIMQAFFAAIARAKHYIYISTPYFLPGEALLTALKVAALSGIDVRLMLPERSDAKMVHWASRSYFTELLEAKVGVYLYRKGFNHSKLMVIDGTFSSVGSANMDARSFEDNFEVTAMIYNSKLAEEMEITFLSDLRYCRHLTLRSWEGRKQKDNFKEAAARLFSPLL